MESNCISTLTASLMVAFLLISTFITMVVSESHIIVLPNRNTTNTCPPGQKKDNYGNCRKIA
nr:U17_MYRTX_Mru1h [Myrmica ruginodis]